MSDKLLTELQAKKSEIEALAAAHGAKSIRVFGSVVRSEESEDSDIDFLVSFDPGYDMLMQRIPLACKLAELIGRQVDLIPEHELNQHIRDSVLKEARFL